MSLEHSYINTSFRFQKSNLFWTVRVYHPKEYIRSNIMNRIYVSGRGKDFLDSAENDRFTNGMIVFYELIQWIVFVSLTPSGSPRHDNKYKKIVETLISEK